MNKYTAYYLLVSFDIFFSKMYNVHDHGTRQQVSENFHHNILKLIMAKKCCSSHNLLHGIVFLLTPLAPVYDIFVLAI